MTLILFIFALAGIAFHFSGYILVLALLRLVRSRPLRAANPQALVAQKTCHIIIPTWNEADYIRAKLENSLALTYSKKKIWVVDGGSTDNTTAIAWSFGDAISIVVLETASKIAQLNAVLAQIPAGDFILITDADAQIVTADAIERALSYWQNNTAMGLIGAWTTPVAYGSLGSEQAYWDKQNRLRYLETRAFSASIVVAPFYLFERSILEKFPEDCVADDIFLSFLAHQKDLRIIYPADIRVNELRTPSSFAQLFKHKLRKANAYTVELLRPLYRLGHMGKRLKFFYCFKLLQFFYFPWLLLIWCFTSANLLLHGQAELWAKAHGILFLLLLLTSLVITPAPGQRRGGLAPKALLHTIIVFALTNIVLLLNSLLFPFWRQASSYERLQRRG